MKIIRYKKTISVLMPVHMWNKSTEQKLTDLAQREGRALLVQFEFIFWPQSFEESTLGVKSGAKCE